MEERHCCFFTYRLGSETVKFVARHTHIVIRCELRVTMVPSHLDVKGSIYITQNGEVLTVLNL